MQRNNFDPAKFDSACARLFQNRKSDSELMAEIKKNQEFMDFLREHPQFSDVAHDPVLFMARLMYKSKLVQTLREQFDSNNKESSYIKHNHKII